jgi:hypothetical protein
VFLVQIFGRAKTKAGRYNVRGRRPSRQAGTCPVLCWLYSIKPRPVPSCIKGSCTKRGVADDLPHLLSSSGSSLLFSAWLCPDLWWLKIIFCPGCAGALDLKAPPIQGSTCASKALTVPDLTPTCLCTFWCRKNVRTGYMLSIKTIEE